MRDFLGVMILEHGATIQEVKVRYQFLACRLHPDKHDPEVMVMTLEEAMELFKPVNNTQQFICDTVHNL